MKKIRCFLAVTLCIHSTSYAFCPFEDQFTIDQTTLKFIPFSSKSQINIGVNTDTSGNISNNNTVVKILQDKDHCSNWGNGLVQIRIGEDNKNYCDIDIWDGAGMPEATLSRINCNGTLKDKLIGLTHTLSTSEYQITVNSS